MSQKQQNESMKTELKLVLQAIEMQRAVLEQVIEAKFQELVATFGPADAKALYSRAVTSSEAQIENAKLLNLYGLIGSQSSQYITALEAA